MKGTNRNRTLITALLALSLAGSAALAGCSSSDTSAAGTAGKVTVTIDITAAVEADDPTAVAIALEKGSNTYSAEVGIDEGATAMSATKSAPFIVATSNNSYGENVDSIDGLASGAVSDQAGWTFTINGEFAMVGADSVDIKDGDVIVWTYVTSWE